MNTVRFVHRPISDEARNDDTSQTREPLIDPEGIKTSPLATGANGSGLGAMVSGVVRVRKRRRNGTATGGRKLDPERWLPKD